MLRDDGPLSRAELADATGCRVPRRAVQIDRLVTLGLAEDAGLAVSRGGRRSTMVRLPAEMRSSASTSGDFGGRRPDRRRAARTSQGESALRRPHRPWPGPRRRRGARGQAACRRRAAGHLRRRRGGARPGELPRRRSGRAAADAGLEPRARTGHAEPGARLPGHRRQRRQHHGVGGAAVRRRPRCRGLPVHQDRYGDRLRRRPRGPGASRGQRQCRGHRAHPGRGLRARLARAATPAVSRRSSAARRWRSEASAAKRAGRRCWPSDWRPRVCSPPWTSGLPQQQAIRWPWRWYGRVAGGSVR